MDLQIIRKYLDELDTALRFILLQRMALISLVGEIKAENNLPVFQPEREKQIFKSIQDFCENTGLNTQLLNDIYTTIIKDAHRIENEIIDGSVSIQGSLAEDNSIAIFDEVNSLIKEYVAQIETLKLQLHAKNITGEYFIKTFTDYYSTKI